MPDNQPTPPVEVQQKDPNPGGVPFTPANDEMVSAFNDTKRREFLDQQKPRETGDQMALQLAKDLLDKKAPTRGVKNNDNQLKNRMISIKGDLVNAMNAQSITPPDDPKDREKLKDQEADFNKNIASRYDIPQKDIKEGTILPVPKDYKSDQFDVIGTKNPAWTKQYIQLRKDPTTGKLSWEGYNKPSMIEGKSEVTVAGTTRFKDPGYKEVVDKATGLKSRSAAPEITKFWETENNDKDYSEGAIKGTSLLRGQEAKGNYRLTKMMSSRPELWKAFKGESEKLTSQNLNDEGIALALKSAISKSYGLEKKWSEVINNTPQYDILNAINKSNEFSDYSKKFEETQNNLAAKIILAGEPTLYAGNPKPFDELRTLEAQMHRDPKSLSKEDKKRYNELKLGLANGIAEVTKETPIAKAFKTAAEEYSKRYKEVVSDVTVLGTKDGKAALDLMAKQSEGYALMDRFSDYIPSFKRSDEEQKKLNESGDWLSSFKSFGKGLIGSMEDVRGGLGLALGFSDMGMSKQFESEKEMRGGDIKLPQREGKTTWDKIANFSDEMMGFGGMMVPFVAATAATGGALGAESFPAFMMREGFAFGAQGLNTGYREGRAAGLSRDASLLRGTLIGSALALGQKLVPKGKMFDTQLLNKEVDNLVKTAIKNPERIKDFVYSFVQGGASGASAVAATEALDFITNSAFNIYKGTDFKSEGFSPDNIIKQGLMFGTMASFTHGLSTFGNQRSARAMITSMAESHPQMVLRSLDDAMMNAVVDNSYDMVALRKLKESVAGVLQFAYPKEFSKEQRIASFDLYTQKQELRSEQATADASLKDIYDKKIKDTDAKLEEIAGSHGKAQKHLDEISEPLYKNLEKQGYFEANVVPKEKPTEVVPKEGGPVMVRHAQSTSNEKGLGGNPNDPLTAEGEKQATELGVKLKKEGVVNVIASPAERSQQTADHITHETGGDVTTLDDLAEWNTGHGDKPVADFDAKHWVNNPDERPSKDAESFNEFLDRVQRARGDIEGLNKETAVVTHGKVLKLMTALDNNGGEWNAKAKAEFLNGKEFENAEPHRDGKPMKAEKPVEMSEEEKTKADINDKIANRHGFKYEELVKNMQKEKLLKIRCPAGGRSTPRGSKMVKSMSSL